MEVLGHTIPRGIHFKQLQTKCGIQLRPPQTFECCHASTSIESSVYMGMAIAVSKGTPVMMVLNGSYNTHFAWRVLSWPIVAFRTWRDVWSDPTRVQCCCVCVSLCLFVCFLFFCFFFFFFFFFFLFVLFVFLFFYLFLPFSFNFCSFFFYCFFCCFFSTPTAKCNFMLTLCQYHWYREGRAMVW